MLRLLFLQSNRTFLHGYFIGLKTSMIHTSKKMVTKIMLIIGRKIEINIQMLKECGKAVRTDLCKMCVSNIMGQGDVAHIINGIQ